MDALRLERGDVSLAAVDFGGHGPPVILLHGLAGYGGEWIDTASWLCRRHRVVAPDLRGHGNSDKVPWTVAPRAFVTDLTAWLDALGVERAAVVGQSFGGLIAFLAAALHPERVARLVVAEASPAPDPDAEADVRAWLESWPVPFRDVDAAIRFFGGESLRARAWARGLEAREGGLWPRFDVQTLLRTLRESAAGWWDEWSSIRCPTLVVRGEHGLPADEGQAMIARVEGAALAAVPGAGHDVHLERPDEWRRVVQPFLAEEAP
ncbi:MAG TPA: alpha/beta hydrolase [Gaiellaceae bacterium]|nr:alpha/beta hydrolase [Gaiellaceae bacterium]